MLEKNDFLGSMQASREALRTSELAFFTPDFVVVDASAHPKEFECRDSKYAYLEDE